MTDDRRCYVPGGSFFFTVVTERRALILGNDVTRDLLRAACRDVRQRGPFRINALIMLRDHLHAIWTLPPDDADDSKRWGAINNRDVAFARGLPSPLSEAVRERPRVQRAPGLGACQLARRSPYSDQT